MPVTDHSETLGDGVSPRDELMLMMMCFFQILDVYLYYNICILYTHIFINIYIHSDCFLNIRNTTLEDRRSCYLLGVSFHSYKQYRYGITPPIRDLVSRVYITT